MTIPATSVSAAVAFLFAGLTSTITAETGHDLWIEYGEPLADNEGEPVEVEPDDQIFLVEVSNRPAPFALVGSLGAGAMQETFGIKLMVRCQREDADATAAFDRCVALVNAIASVARTDPTLGGAVLTARPDAVIYPSPASANNGTRRICQTDVTINCFAVN